MINTSGSSANHHISQVDITSDLLADRGGLVPMMRYLDNTGLVDGIIGPIEQYRTGKKGVAVSTMIRQVLAFFFDGTSRHLTWFDDLKRDPGYQALLETSVDQMISSHQVKRYFHKLPSSVWSGFRNVLRRMFSTRLQQEKPQVVELFLDTMVLDNDDAICREGCEPTYKKVKGFQPLQLIWDGQIIDAQFRGGSKNGNHGLTAFNMVKKAVKKIREVLGYEVPIVVRMDGGFFDGELFWRLDVANVGFVCAGRMNPEIKAFAKEQTQWESLDGGKQRWSYFEFGTRCKKWDQFYRAVYLKPLFDGDQMVLDFARPEGVILTNMGSCSHLFKKVDPGILKRLTSIAYLVKTNHARGADELTHRALKDFGFEQLPFKKFGANMSFYYLMVIAFNMMEWYKQDVLVDLGLVSKRSYATTIRRKTVDFAAKIVRKSRKVIMKVTQTTMDRLKLDELWQKCHEPPRLLA